MNRSNESCSFSEAESLWPFLAVVVAVVVVVLMDDELLHVCVALAERKIAVRKRADDFDFAGVITGVITYSVRRLNNRCDWL